MLQVYARALWDWCNAGQEMTGRSFSRIDVARSRVTYLLLTLLHSTLWALHSNPSRNYVTYVKVGLHAVFDYPTARHTWRFNKIYSTIIPHARLSITSHYYQGLKFLDTVLPIFLASLLNPILNNLLEK